MMRRRWKPVQALLASAVFLAAGCAAKQETPDYAVLARAPGPEGGYDYASIDSARNLLFIGREFGVMTVDVATGKQARLIERDDVAAVLLIPDSDLLLTTNGGSNSATLLDRVTGAVAAEFKTGTEPDGATYDKASGLAFVMNGGSADITLIDIAKRTVVGTVPVGGTPEAAVADGHGSLYVNIEDHNEIAVVDIAARRVVRHIPLAGCEEPTAIALDPATGLLISTCRNKLAKFIEASTGADKGSLAIGRGADASIFDAGRRLGFIASIDGTLVIYRLSEDGKAELVSTIKTRDGARTAALDTQSGRLYLPGADVVWDKDGHYVSARKNFEIVTVGPAKK